MKKVLLIATILITTIFSAQTAKQIFDKNIENTGGIVNWKLLNSIVLQGKVFLGINDEYFMKIISKDLILQKLLYIWATKKIL